MSPGTSLPMSMNTPKQMRKESAMKTLYEAMRDFNARNANENTIQGMFAEIAVPALSGGYFLVNNDTRIYPMDIEFYLYGERKEEEPWMKDANMYHKGCNKNFLIWKEKISSRKERLSPRKEKLSYHVARGRISIQGGVCVEASAREVCNFCRCA